jgi:hypothetical protein
MVSTPEKLSVDAETNSILLTLRWGKSMGWMESYSRLGSAHRKVATAQHRLTHRLRPLEITMMVGHGRQVERLGMRKAVTGRRDYAARPMRMAHQMRI